jgi:hypothetical protein
MFKKLTSVILSVILLTQPIASNAASLSDAFNSLVGGATGTFSQPGRFQSAARTGVSAGGLEVRVPRPASAPQLFSVTPLEINAGCNGISAHFGGFSFISGAEFEKLLSTIASGAALGFVTSMVMKVLCPICESVVQELKTAAQMASRLASDSCKFGQEMATKLFEGNGGANNSMEVCGTTAQASNETSDVLKAYSSVCNGIRSSTNWLASVNRGLSAEATNTGLACKLEQGNVTWQRLSAFDSSGTSDAEAYSRKVLLLNLMGAELYYHADIATVSCEEDSGTTVLSETEKRSKFCPPRLDTAQVSGLFMCGAPDADGKPKGARTERVLTYCQEVYTKMKKGGGLASEAKVMACKSDDKTNCSELTLQDAGAVINGEGLLVSTNALLHEAVSRVRQNRSITGDDTGKKIIGLIQAAPYPLYQAINAAAVYPAAADDLLDSMSILVSEQFAYSMLNDMLRMNGRSGGNGRSCLSPPQAEKILDFMTKFRAENNARGALIAQNFAIQEAITEQIRQINLAIQRQVLSQDLLSTGKLTEALNKTVIPTKQGVPALGSDPSAGSTTP